MLMQRMFLTPAGRLEVDGQGRWKHALAESVVPLSLSRVEPGLQWSAEGSRLSLTPWSPGGPVGSASATAGAWRAAVCHWNLSEEQSFQNRHFCG